MSCTPDGAPGLEVHFERELDELRAAGLLRAPRPIPDGALVLCSNDYLGLAAEPALCPGDARSGAGASRLISGDHPHLVQAETALADWVQSEAALLFSSGYAANVGCLSALASSSDVIVSDELNHASIIDGCRLSRAHVEVIPHLDPNAAAEALARHASARRRWLVTESYFSMDGDTPDLRELRRLCNATDTGLVVDEAHALGVFGDQGRGLCHHAGIVPDVFIGTLGKAVGLAGAFVAGSARLRSVLWNRARSFVFSTGVSPGLAAAITARVARVRSDDAARARLAELATRFREELTANGQAPVLEGSHGPIVPWMVGDSASAVALSDALRKEGIVVAAIRPPTVPEGTARLRVTLHAKLSDDDLRRSVAAFCARRR